MNNRLLMTRMALNNWHYINEQILSFNQDINFFTGHSGSGKSTVLDAMQLLLYADTDGRSFFNKAAKDDSNRTLIEYLRGMNNVGENGEATYLRNQNFSTTIAVEFKNTSTNEFQTVGVSFDVEVGTNNTDRLFFWHRGQLLENGYRYEKKTMTCNQVKEYLSRRYEQEDWWFSRTNDKFRTRLYETYLGGLDERKFPMLFKKAISFRMDTKLEDFVKEFICVEKDIHIEDMQESVIQYVRLKRKLEDTKQEIEYLEKINEKYKVYDASNRAAAQYTYSLQQVKLDILNDALNTNQTKQAAYKTDLGELGANVVEFEQKVKSLQEEQVNVKTAIKNSGFDHLAAEEKSLSELVSRYHKSKLEYDRIVQGLMFWKLVDGIDVSSLLPLFERVEAGTVTEEELNQIRTTIAGIRKEQLKTIDEKKAAYNQLKEECAETKRELTTLQSGKKAYQKELVEAKEFIAAELKKETGSDVEVNILADLIDVKEEAWLNAVEGFMSNNKLALCVEPKFVKQAMAIYEKMDAKRYHKIVMIDTERVVDNKREPLKNALSEEIITDLPYVQAYVDFLMGSVIKCDTMEELRKQRSGITKDCVLYHNYSIKHIDPKHYHKFAYIGQSSIQRRLKILTEQYETMQERLAPMGEAIEKISSVLALEYLDKDNAYYMGYLEDIHKIASLEVKITDINAKINELKTKDLSLWKEEEVRLQEEVDTYSKKLSSAMSDKQTKERELESLKSQFVILMEQHNETNKAFEFNGEKNKEYQAFIKKNEVHSLERVRSMLEGLIKKEADINEAAFTALTVEREQYLNQYGFRGFSITAKENTMYENLYVKLSSEKLSEFMNKAGEQAKKAVDHFKTDFVYKIRDAIKEALQQKEDLNQILKKTDFGKEKYRFVIEKNKGEDGKFYTMFMDENLEINPKRLSNHMDNQIDLFSANHEDKYNDLINELIDIFMPPEDCDKEQLEEARRNIEKYADYRTYLSFDMEQIIEGMAPMRLSKMLTKNSGGEGQNPLYVALLASFAEVYKISLRKNVRRRVTPRLVILDEAFSKMDGEKVASCVELIRKLGFQAIISATNDKMQNYVESVDKTFVFANPNKSYISIQPFEKAEFHELLDEKEEM
ncbi:MAG: SbcC/MukB-like Walker B domain-containing protein [bacterium]|nr:SbcC/MukB-like Walker B domain-containing protein [bacterium]